ncbi:hypothetical protein [Bradyrhizobium sp.]|uniref:hypothetical protein n=1 Tax=Bradyrhizobium sp. TaxID=376 RepID=UPI004038093B
MIKIPPPLDLDSRVPVDNAIEEHHPMPTKDGFDPAEPLPQFLAARAEQGMQGSENDFDGTVTTSRVFKAGILIAAVTATGLAVLAMGNPASIFADESASLVGDSSPPSAPTTQSAADPPVASTADAQAVPPNTNDAPARAEIAVTEPAGKDQAEKSESSSESLFRQFQVWAAEQDAQAQGGPAQPDQAVPEKIVQPVPAATNVPAPVAENVRAPQRLVQKRRQVRAVSNARAEMRTQSLRKQVQRAPSARAERPPVQDARAQDASAQNAQTPSFLPFFGLRN